MRVQLTGNDNHGTVYLDGNRIVRAVDPGYMPTITDVLRRLDALDDAVREHVVGSRLLEGAELEHEPLTISYPSEWSPSMLRDVTLLQLDLWISLRRAGLTLKDAMPTNYLFRRASPTLVDVLSIVPTERLGEERWLASLAGGGSMTQAIMRSMFVPYFAVPLLLASSGDSAAARRAVARCMDPYGPRDGGRALWRASAPVRRRLKALGRFGRLRRIVHERDDDASLADLREFVDGLPVTPADRGYLSYYAAKGEAFDYTRPDTWKPKQRSVDEALRRVRPRTVLDLGANTGWFSVLAARRGARVVATDIDVSCVDALYRKSAAEGLDVLPLHLTFAELEQRPAPAEAPGDAAAPHPLPAIERLKADLVLCLGLVHHLTLGEGRTVASVLDTLRGATERACLLEFVSLDDPLIAQRPDYFPKVATFDRSSYDVDLLEREARQRFRSVERLPSHPETRSLWLLRA